MHGRTAGTLNSVDILQKAVNLRVSFSISTLCPNWFKIDVSSSNVIRGLRVMSVVGWCAWGLAGIQEAVTVFIPQSTAI